MLRGAKRRGNPHLFRQKSAKNAKFMRFRNGLPRQSVPQGHLLRGADWLAMTGFFDSLRKTTQRAVFLYFSRSAQQNRRGSNSLPGIPRMAEPFAGALPLPLDLTRCAQVEAASSILPAAFQKERHPYGCLSFWNAAGRMELAASTCAQRVKSRGKGRAPANGSAIRGMPGSEFEPRLFCCAEREK